MRDLPDTELRYRTLFEVTRDGILIVDSEGRYVDVNDSLCRILKTTRERLIGAHFSEFIPSAKLAEAEDAFAGLKAGGRTPLDFPLRAADGSNVDLEWTSSSGYLPGLYFCVCRDITGRRREERSLRARNRRAIAARKRGGEAVRESEGRYRILAESLPQLVWTASCSKRGSARRSGPKEMSSLATP